MEVEIPAGKRRLVPLGIACQCPEGSYIRIAPKSGLSVKKSLDVGAGVVDHDFIGKIRVLLCNNGKDQVEIKRGERVAQLIIEQIHNPLVEVVSGLEETSRGARGFGSTGINRVEEIRVDNVIVE